MNEKLKRAGKLAAAFALTAYTFAECAADEPTALTKVFIRAAKNLKENYIATPAFVIAALYLLSQLNLQKYKPKSKDEEKSIAYHESGHALTAVLLPGVTPLKKVTIIPDKSAAGYAQFEDPRGVIANRQQLENALTCLMAGRAGEAILGGSSLFHSQGAVKDIEYGTALAREMITKWGMSEKIGPVHYSIPASGF